MPLDVWELCWTRASSLDLRSRVRFNDFEEDRFSCFCSCGEHEAPPFVLDGVAAAEKRMYVFGAWLVALQLVPILFLVQFHELAEHIRRQKSPPAPDDFQAGHVKLDVDGILFVGFDQMEIVVDVDSAARPPRSVTTHRTYVPTATGRPVRWPICLATWTCWGNAHRVPSNCWVCLYCSAGFFSFLRWQKRLGSKPPSRSFSYAV